MTHRTQVTVLNEDGTEARIDTTSLPDCSTFPDQPIDKQLTAEQAFLVQRASNATRAEFRLIDLEKQHRRLTLQIEALKEHLAIEKESLERLSKELGAASYLDFVLNKGAE